MTATAISTLTAAFEEPFPQAGKPASAGCAVLSWPSVPIEIVRAAGLSPAMMRGASSTEATPAADAHLESGIFPSRLRRLVEAALTGRLSESACIVIPRTSDADYKCFLYLREFVRLGIVPALPPVLLFDLLQSQGPDVQAYNAARTRAIFGELASITGRRPSLDEARREIRATNAARAAARQLTVLRRGTPRVTGSEAFPLLGAFWSLPPEEYAALAGAAADDIARRAPRAGPRVLLAGSPPDNPALHAAIESRGGVVVAEPGPWGADIAVSNVDESNDPIAALSDHYRTHVIGPRTSAGTLLASAARSLGAVDAVVVSLPPEDAVFGWDYPELRDLLESKRIPYVCLHGDPSQPLAPEDDARLCTLLDNASRKEVGVG